MKKSPPFISDFVIDTPVNPGQKTSIQLSGQWPTPGWNHKDTKVDIDQTSKTITIEYLGQSKGGLMMQVIKPFSDEIVVTFPTPGTWTVSFIGRGDDMSKTVQVEE